MLPAILPAAAVGSAPSLQPSRSSASTLPRCGVSPFASAFSASNYLCIASVGAGAVVAVGAGHRRQKCVSSRYCRFIGGAAANCSRVGVGIVCGRQALQDEFLDFVGKTGSPAHTVLESKRRLEAAGFKELREGEVWQMQKGGLYYVTQQGTNICAFAVGGAFDASTGGVVMAAAHTDSPCLKIRPCSKLPEKANTLQLGVDTYGGGLWHTWFDRPLGLAGKIVVAKSGSEVSGPRGFEERLVRVDEPVCVIPNLAIHLQTADERKAFGVNKETQLRPVLCAPPPMGRGGTSSSTGDSTKGDASADGDVPVSKHREELLDKVARAAGVDANHVVDVDLCLMDASPPCLMGPYVSTPRIDNVLSTWAAVDALAAFAEGSSLATSKDILIAASFDHEEVGSVSATGADSAAMERWLQRCLEALGAASDWSHMASRSFLLSCDCAHGLHPNYADKHQSEHAPVLGSGIVIKTNANQRYATTPSLAQMVREVGRLADLKVQEFVVRNDCPCGSTIGPLLSAQLGVRTVDVGAPQWAMHSCRETAHGDDVAALRDLCLGTFTHFRSVDEQFVAL